MRSYVLDSTGIYVRWTIINKTCFYSWKTFKDVYSGRINILGENLDVIVFSTKKRRIRINPRYTADGLCPFTTFSIVCSNSEDMVSKPDCAQKDKIQTLLEQCNVTVEWDAKLYVKKFNNY